MGLRKPSSADVIEPSSRCSINIARLVISGVVVKPVGTDGTSQISRKIRYYVRLSCISNSQGVPYFSTVPNISNDNQIGFGTTPTTWDLITIRRQNFYFPDCGFSGWFSLK
jgi:hypothetical protein